MRLRDYGLLVTADHRVVSARSTILDDGHGAIVVGWRDNDLAAAELEPWPRVEKPVPKPVFRTRAAAPDIVATPPEPDDEGDWDWEIAVARARAVAEEIEAARPAPPVTVLRIIERPSEAPTRQVAIDPLAIDPPTRQVAIDPPPEARRTIIPIPTLPRASAGSPVRPLDQPRRFPRATDRHTTQDDDRTRPGISVPASRRRA